MFPKVKMHAHTDKCANQPGWMDDYEGYVLPQAVSYTTRAAAVREETDWSRETNAKMSPLTQRTRRSVEFLKTSSSHIGATAPGYASTLQPYQCPAAVIVCCSS